MKKYIVAFLIFIGLAGCASISPSVMIGNLEIPEKFNLSTELQEDDYPGFLTGSGNAYSCRYGIDIIRSNKFNPPKEQIFYALLTKNSPDVTKHSVTLYRFDVYYNTKGRLPWITGGTVGRSNTKAADAKNYGYHDKNLIVDIIPETYPIETSENAVGCDGYNEGEYYASRVTDVHSVVVIWLKFEIDDRDYHFRTLYQIHPDNIDERQEGLNIAIEKSIAAISALIKI